ncbi:ClbS/DfsB family four-helix bundle protein [Gymnodinialimonas sp.]
MPAATTKADLMTVTDREWTKLNALLEKVPGDLAETKDADDTCIKDILTHRAHWIGLFFQWLEEGAAAQMPDHGVKWNELKAYNAGLRDRYADVTWDAARAGLTEAHGRLRDWIAQSDDAALYGEPMPGGTGWTPGRYAEAAGPSHYRSAAKYIRSVLKAAG